MIMKKGILFIFIILASGATAGLIHGTVNTFVVNPYLEQAIEIENQALFSTGEAKDTVEFRAGYESYRDWQRGGQILASIVLGAAVGSLFGAVFLISKESLPGKNYISKALLLAGIMWVALYVIAFIKYPPSPPAVGDPETITVRTALYVSLLVASGIGVIGFAKIAFYMHKVKNISAKSSALISVGCYAAFAIVLCIALPPNPDPEPMMDSELLDGFRVASAIGVTAFWASAGIILGLAWNAYARKYDNTHKSLNSDSR